MSIVINIIVIIWLLIKSSYANEHLRFGIPGTNGIILYKQKYVLLHDYNRKIPLWTSYHLASTDLKTGTGRHTSFKPDHDLPGAQRSELSDYKGSGYDRGHMVPSVDMKKNHNAVKESCLLSNIVPQNPSCNRGIWRIIELKAREMAVKYREVWIITGPVFEKQPEKKIGSGVCVPDGFYKIIVYVEGEMSVWQDESIKAVAYLVSNEKHAGGHISIDYIEMLTGLDFLSKLPDDVEEEIEKGLPER